VRIVPAGQHKLSDDRQGYQSLRTDYVSGSLQTTIEEAYCACTTILGVLQDEKKGHGDHLTQDESIETEAHNSGIE
jgi:hypothetical protein